MSHELAIGERWNNRALFGLLAPLVIEQILAVTMGAIDTIMVSTVGEYAVSAVNIIDNINNLLIIAFTALCTGGTVVVSQYIGRRDYANSKLAAKHLVYIVAVISIVMMTGALLLRYPIINLLYGRIEHDVMEAAAVYLFVTGLSYPFLAVYNANAALFRTIGNSKVSMKIALMVNIMNIGGNAFFIYVLKIGVMGVALSTLIFRMVAASITTIMLNRNGNIPVSLSGMFRLRPVRSMIKNILFVGIPSAIENSMFQTGRLMTQRIFTYFGTSAIAANAIASVIISYSFMPGMAFGLALLTIVGQCIGAGDYVEAKKQTFKIMKLAYLTLFIISTLIFIFLRPLTGLFNLSPQAHEMAVSFLRIHCISMALGWSMGFVLPNALRAAGDVRYVMIAASTPMWLVRVSTSYIFTFALGLGPLGVWLAMGADFIVRGTLYCVRWVGGRWQGKKVISDDG
ncbi:MAG: MATE family efflux transporter [Treponema sp.]|nr:MATE family efflux transporter [Treponema sp.]